MALPEAIQNETGRVVTITWTRKGTTDAEPLTGFTITGVIEDLPGPDASNRAINGALAVTDGPNGVFTWTYTVTDTASNGKFNVHFIATLAGIVLKTEPTLWEVVRAPTVS